MKRMRSRGMRARVCAARRHGINPKTVASAVGEALAELSQSPLMLDDKLEIIMAILNVLSICGSLRKGSFNAMVQRLLPSLAPTA
jgi:hypothetical protein